MRNECHLPTAASPFPIMRFLTPASAQLLGAAILAAAFGYLAGRIIDTHIAMASVSPLAVVPDTRPRVPVVNIEGIRNGFIEGMMSSGARLIIGETYVVPTASGTIRVAAAPFLTNHVTVEVPVGMRFVASKAGKKYYPVNSAAGSRLKPENRVYFATEEEARRAGYIE